MDRTELPHLRQPSQEDLVSEEVQVDGVEVGPNIKIGEIKSDIYIPKVDQFVREHE